MGFDTWADTSCAGKHAHVLEWIDGHTVTAEGFSGDLGRLESLPLVNVAYAYDTHHGETYILRDNNSIYLGDHMEDCLANPIQCMESGTRIDLRSKKIYPDQDKVQTMSLPNGIVIPIVHNGPLPIELDTCEHVDITEHEHWDPYSGVHKVHSVSKNAFLDFDIHILYHVQV